MAAAAADREPELADLLVQSAGRHLGGIWAADLLVVQTVSFRTLYVLFFIRHERRELVHFNVTARGLGSSSVLRRSMGSPSRSRWSAASHGAFRLEE